MAFLTVLFMIALLALAAAAATLVWSIEARRDKELDLLFIGGEFTRALDAYRRHSGAIAQPYPRGLDDLTDDHRGSSANRYLRHVYIDPMTGALDWELIRNAGGGIVAIRSPSHERPIKTSGFPLELDGFGSAKTYRDWVFRATGAALSASIGVDGSVGELAATAGPDPVVPTPLSNAGAAPAPRRGVSPLNAAQGTVDGCNTILSADLALCAGQGARFGSAAAADCNASAVVRNSECLSSEPLGSLYLRVK